MFVPTLALMLLVTCSLSECHNKYSKEANQPTKLTDEFRMGKIKTIWQKAQKRLSANKLQALYKDLREQDKIELTLKKLKSENHDKNGLKEMETRSKLNVILARYDLRDVMEAMEEQDKPADSKHHQQLFKDKNLDKLWNKAMQSKFSDEELKILKEEFQHYESKMSEYHNLIDKVHELEDRLKDEDEKWENSIERLGDKHTRDKSTKTNHLQHLNEKHKEMKSKFSDLQDKVLKHQELNKSRLFEEDDTEKLWKAAQDANFDETELEVVKRELFHFDHRLQKLNYLHSQMEVDEFQSKYKQTMEDLDESKYIKNRIKELTKQVEKLRDGVMARIKLQRHSEL